MKIAEQLQFHHRNQTANETVTEYEAELHHLATHCAFVDYPMEVICGHIVCGLAMKVFISVCLQRTSLP